MLHLLQHPQSTLPNPNLTFGPPILNAYAKVADILGRAIASSAPAPVPAPRVPVPLPAPPQPEPAPVPRVPVPILAATTPAQHLAKYLAHSMQHDPTIADKMYDPSTGRPETIDSLLKAPTNTSGSILSPTNGVDTLMVSPNNGLPKQQS